MVSHHPTNKLIGREPIPHQKKTLSTHPHAKASEYPVLAPVSGRYPKEGGRLLTCYSPVRHSSTQQKPGFSVRLACVKHAASVRPEPGSNSPNKNKNVKAQKNQPENPVSNPNQKHSKTKNRHKQNKQTHYRVHKQHPHDQTHTDALHVFERRFAPCFRDFSSSLRSLPFGATRKTIRTSKQAVKSQRLRFPKEHFPQDSAILADFSRH